MSRILTSLIVLTVICTLAAAKSVELSSAQIYKGQGDYLKALEFYNKAITDYEAEKASLKASNPDDASFQKKAKNIFKDLGVAYFEAGECLKQLGDYGKMSESFNKSLENSDKYMNDIADYREELWVTFYNDGVPLFNEKKYAEALAKFELAVLVDSENPEGYKERGMCYLQLSQLSEDSVKAMEYHQKAAADFDFVIANDPEGKEINIRLNKANMYYQDKDFAKAIPAYQEVMKVDPSNVTAVSKLAFIYQEQGESGKSVEMYNKILQTKGDDPDLLFNLGILYFQMNEFAKAKDAFDRVLKINPDDVETIMNLVSSLWKAQMEKESIPYLERVVVLQPDNKMAWQFLFVAYTKAEEMTKAKEAYDKYKALEAAGK